MHTRFIFAIFKKKKSLDPDKIERSEKKMLN